MSRDIKYPLKNPMVEHIGFEEKTTFWTDFSLAEGFSDDAVKETYEKAFREGKDSAVYLTELVLVLNWKIWQYYDSDPKLAKLYNNLWYQTDQYAVAHLKGKELNYFYRMTD